MDQLECSQQIRYPNHLQAFPGEQPNLSNVTRHPTVGTKLILVCIIYNKMQDNITYLFIIDRLLNSQTLSSSAMEKNSVVSALLNYVKGEQRELDLLIRRLQLTECKDKYAADVLLQMKDSVSLLNPDCFSVVVQELLKVSWFNRSAEVVKLYHSFIVNLVSAHSTYTEAVLTSMVALFMPKKGVVAAVEGTSQEQTDEDRQKNYEAAMIHVHNTIASVLKAVPSAGHMLSSIIHDKFPYIFHKDASVVEMYIQNILYVTKYCPPIRSQILSLVIVKMINLDTRASRELIEEANETDSEDEELFDLEADATPKEHVDESRNKLTEADRLDTIMCVMFNYIDSVCRNPDSSLNWEATKKLYLELLSLFEKKILPTDECCHTQYLLFYICSLKPSLADGFMDYLWKKVKNPNEDKIYRIYAISYLASFVVRASYVSVRSAADAITLFCEWIHRYISTASHNSMHNDIAHHGTFYSVVQAVFYILAFRQKEFLEMGKANAFFLSLNLQTIVTCRLNPLRVCQPVITRTFASFVRKHQLAFCDAIIERNNRLTVPIAEEVSGPPHLESYFPFDPYLLIRSSVKVADLYRVFDGTAIIDIELNKEQDEDDFVQEDNSMVVDNDFGKSPAEAAFLGSISPGFNAPIHSLR
ncbi:RRN3 [Bugula neritina]|uniref:RRN3 n=1 Tax=Bugula neritina TaxID=10212 RepID=A0A7J7JWC9_BUGNE|nr:RRN3 [Bugula neritina]